MERAAGRDMAEGDLPLRDALLSETAGNPFFVGELLHHLSDTGAISRGGDLRQHGLPVSVKEVIGQRVARLGETDRRALLVASVIGREFDFRLLASVCQLNENDLLDILDSTTEAALVVNVSPDRYDFVHALVAHTLYETLTPARRAQTHRQIAEAMEQRTPRDPQLRSIALAHHWAETNDPDGLARAAGHAEAAGDHALAQLAPDEALRWYAQAIELLARSRSGDDELRCRLQVGLGDAQRQSGHPDYRATLLAAATAARDLGHRELLVQAVLANSRGFASLTGDVDAERVALLEAACEESGQADPVVMRLRATQGAGRPRPGHRPRPR